MRQRWTLLLALGCLVATGGATLGWYLAQLPRDERGHKYDPVEDDPKVRPLLMAAQREAEEECKDVKMRLGRSNMIQAVKKRILKEKYGINWRTQAEMNPEVMFD